jgi:hypothetical protein
MRSLRLIAATVTVLLLVACAISGPGVPGHIYESTSKFDNSREITMEPAWLSDSAPGIKLRLFKSTRMPKDQVVMDTIVAGAHSFARGKSLHFNIDGDIVSFSSIDELTDIETSPGFAGGGYYIPPSNWSSKRYLVTMDFLKRIIAAERVIVKVDLRKTYVEGVFSTDGFTTARPAFREFCEKVRAWQ